MLPINIPFSAKAFLSVVLIGLILWFVLRIIKKLMSNILKQTSHKSRFLRYYPILEIIIGVVFLTYAIDYLSESNPLVAVGLFLIALVIALWMSWYYIKSYFLGMVFKLNGKFKINDSIRFKTYQGKIVEMNTRRMIIEDDKGELIFIPYDELSRDIIIKNHPAENILSYHFLLRTPLTKSADDRIKDIRASLLSLPWVSIKKHPNISLIEEANDYQVFDITFYSLEKAYFYRIENAIKQTYLHQDVD